MSAIISSSRGGMCGICHEEFALFDNQVTHVGGENHDGFHRQCLKNWTLRSPTCPYDRTSIDRSSLTTRTERIMETATQALQRTAQALENSSYAAFAEAVIIILPATASGEIGDLSNFALMIIGPLLALSASKVLGYILSTRYPTNTETKLTNITIGIGVGGLLFVAGSPNSDQQFSSSVIAASIVTSGITAGAFSLLNQ